MATRDDFLKQRKRKTKTIEHDEIGEFRIRSLTERDRSEIKVALTKASKKKGGDVMAAYADEPAWVVCYALVDEDDNRLFSSSDVELIKDMDSGLIDAIYEEIDKMCKVSFSKEAGRIDDTAKNLPEIGEDALPSDSPISLVG